MKDLAHRFQLVRKRVERACHSAGRDPSTVRVLAVSKKQPVESIRALFGLGQTEFGENYAQEARAKQEQLTDLAIGWHFIGPIQSNKTRTIAEHFSWVQSADRERIITRLNDQRPDGLPPLNVLLQVNIDREEQKAGADPDDVFPLASLVAELPRLQLRGVMAIPRITTGADGDHGNNTQAAFERLKRMYDELAGTFDTVDTLSMGMSDDLEAAIGRGSTMVRIGTALMGPRPNSGP